jgi:phosphoserine phosphatase
VTSKARTTLLVTVTGRDKPGVASVIFSALTKHRVEILDVEQVLGHQPVSRIRGSSTA